MAKSTVEFQLVKILKEINKRSASSLTKTKWTKHRETEAAQIISYSVHSDAVYADIKKKGSPFRLKFDAGTGPEPSDSEYRSIANEISRELWIRFKRKATQKVGLKNIHKISLHNLPRTVTNVSAVTVIGLDESLRTIVFNGGKKNKFEKFRADIAAPVYKDIKAISDEQNKARQYVQPSGKYRGIVLGHTLGSSSTLPEHLVANFDEVIESEDVDKLEIIDLGRFNDSHAEAIRSEIIKIIGGDASLELEHKFNPKQAFTKIKLTVPESLTANATEGGDVTKANKALRDLIFGLGNELHNLEGSPSNRELLIAQIEAVFLGKKPRTHNKKTKATLHGPTQKITVSHFKVKGARAKIKDSTKKAQPNLVKVLATVNARIEDQVRRNMGKGTSKQQLNWRTGRLGKSIDILALMPSKEKNTIIARTKWFGGPYNRFLKGGDLYKPLRDPRGIIGRSVRQILQEEKIANFRRVKVNFDEQ